MQDRIFYSVCFGFALGVLLRSFIFVNIYTAIFLCVIATVLVLFFTFISKIKWGIVISVFVFAFSLGILRFHAAEVSPFHIYDESIGEKITGEGKIIDAPDVRENNQKLTVEVDVSGVKNKILVTTNFSQDFKYGDLVSISGKVEKPENFITDQGKEFDYVNYLRKDGIFYLIHYPEIEIISHGNGNKIKSILFSLKEKFLEKMNIAIPPPESLLMGGLIVGEKAAFSQELRKSFVDTGTIHIVALSGYNITIIAEWIMKLLASFPRNFGIWTGIFTIFLFIIMTGASSTAIRAGVMATLALVARAP